MNFALNDFGAAVLSNAVLVVPLAALVAVVCRFVKRPAVAWGLWGLVLLKFVTPAWSLPNQTPGVSFVRTMLNEMAPSPVVPDKRPSGRRVSSRSAPPGDRAAPEPMLPDSSRQEPGDEPVREWPRPTNGKARTADMASAVSNEATESVTESSAEVVVPAGPPPDESAFPPGETTSNDELTPSAVAVAEPGVSETSPSHHSNSAAALAGDGPVMTADQPLPSGSLGTGTRDAHPATPSFVGASVAMGPMLAAVWGLGVVVLLCLTAVRVHRFRRLLRQAEPAPAELVDRAGALAARLGCRSAPLLRMTHGRVPPLLWGIGRSAVILLPRGLLDRLDDEQRSALLAHELAHYARRDHWTRWFEQAIRSLYWWHPVAWWAGRELREAEEQCCDAWVVRLLPDSSRRYADALLQTVDFLSTAPRAVPSLATGITPVRRSLRPFHRRLTMIIDHRPSPRLSWPAGLCLLAVAAIVLPVSLHATAEEESLLTERPAERSTEPAKIPDERESNIGLLEAVKIADGLGEVTREQKPDDRATKQHEGAVVAGDESETITVVRTQYELPHGVALALHEFIQANGQHFEFLTSTGPTLQRSDASEDNDTSDGFGGGGSLGRGGFGRGGRGSHGRSGFGGDDEDVSTFGSPPTDKFHLTIIATPEVQQQLGDFIRAIQQPRDEVVPAEGSGESQTLTLARAHYKLPLAGSPRRFDNGFADVGGRRPRRPAGPRSSLGDGDVEAAARPLMGDGVVSILSAVKESNLVPLLLVSASEDGLTVTTTENFQQHLGKFIRFLQKHEPKAAAMSSGAVPSGPQPLSPRTVPGPASPQPTPAAQTYLPSAVQPPRADSPTFVAPSTGGPKSAASRLSDLRARERELVAVLEMVDDALKEDGDRAAVLLMVHQFYGGNTSGDTFMKMMSKLADLEMEKKQMESNATGLGSGLVVRAINTLRRSLGLPTRDKTEPLDRLDVYVKALRQQLDTVRKVIEAIEKRSKAREPVEPAINKLPTY